MWTKSACVVLAWSILPIIVVTVGMQRVIRPAQANIRTASNTTEITPASIPNAAAAPRTAASPAARYVVQPGDTLSGIAARLAVRGGWPALYAANRKVIGRDPNVIRPGTALVLPGRMAPIRYRVVPGDTLSGIAAGLAVRGGWPALYAANRKVIGRDPNVIRPGTVLTVPRPAVPSPPVPGPVPPRHPAPPSRGGHLPSPGQGVPATAGLPGWLKTVLLAVGLLIGAALIAELVLVAVRGRRRGAAAPPAADADQQGGTRIVLADHDRLIVTRSTRDDTVCVLRPPGEDPRAILRAARLVLPEGSYWELAARLGMPAGWPIMLADHDRLVVTRHRDDDTVYVLRPPGEDPRAILRVARLVLPEEPYQELADQLGVSAGWPME
jgi:LysM repeat protein